jgi:hypothetical protein
MGRKPRVDRPPEEKWQIVQEGIKSGQTDEGFRNMSGQTPCTKMALPRFRMLHSSDAGNGRIG